MSQVFKIMKIERTVSGLRELDLRYTDLSSVPPHLLAAVLSRMEVTFSLEQSRYLAFFSNTRAKVTITNAVFLVTRWW